MKLIPITEPSTILINDDAFFRILTELPDIDEEEIRIELENNPAFVSITASGDEIIYRKTILIPGEVRFHKKRFSDGVLEIILEKKPLFPLQNLSDNPLI